MTKRKFLVLAVCVLLAAVFTVPAYATSEDWASEVLDTIDEYENGNVNVVYTTDSVIRTGITWDTEIDVLSKQLLLVVRTDLPAGYVVFDSPDTPYIDGIRLNGQTVDSYKIPIDYTQDVDYELVVRIVYADGFVGSLAQISDGTFDWVTLLENPVGLIVALYYVLATISVVIAIISVIRNKNKQVKSADEIAAQVKAKSEETAMAIIEERVLPVVTTFQNTAQALVKAFALTTSKSKEAPTALLEILQKVSNTDATAAIEEAKKLIEADRAKADAAVQSTKAALNNIAHTIQEVSTNGTEQLEQAPEKEDVAIF